MRKKQLYAVILAGVVAAGSVPGTAFAAQQDSVQTAAETIDNESAASEAPSEPAETPDASTEAPSEPTVTPNVPTETPAEPTETPAEPNGDAQPVPETTVTPEATVTPEPSATPIPGGPVETDMGVSVNLIQADESVKPVYYATLQDAVNAALEYYQAEDHDKSKAVVVEITKQFSLSETVRIENGKINIVAAADVSIGRIDPQDPNKVLDGDMFVVTGKDSELQLSAKNGGRLTLSGENGSGGAELSSGALVRVENEGSFGISDGVILSGNTTSAEGAAIDSKGGSVVLKGGTITGNSGTKGAVYSNADIAVQGTVSIKDNTGANLYLDGEAAAVVTDALTNSSISLTASAAADQKVVAKAGSKADGTPVSADEFKVAAEQFSYDTEDYSIILGTDGLTAVLKQEQTVTTPTPTPTTSPSFLTYQSKTLKWVDHNTATAVMSTTKDCKWYYYFVDAGTSAEDIKRQYNANNAKNEAKANTKFTVKAEKIPEKETWLVVAAKPTTGSAQLRVLKLNNNSRPAAPVTPTVTTRAPRKYQVTESKITGLENPLKFFPRKFYDFQVVGAGQNDKDPVSNDERWIPLYWSMSVNGTKNNSWRIGSQEKGIREAATYPLYVFFRKQTYNGKEWVDTDVVEYMKTSFSSAEITDEEWNAYIDEYNNEHPDDGLNYDGTGAGSVADLTPTEAPSSQDTGSSERNPADTADNTPLGSMSALAALSLLAGGYVIVRKRKKEKI